ncbi:3' terminal RNA ribose 2'-O-methyltransferase Hen1 [Neobacillus sp. FSL H8-0543]|uniref:3' terminal RNA ribose 2'-O-methyltransferase Hen1 n=1 Tax=Neobacillus sp. FSL H8-0543 TaxID=2954672 RepID=UPI00315819BA
MQLSLTVRGTGAETVSYLIAKNPTNLYERNEKGFKVRLVYPTFTNDEAEFLIYVQPDPIDLARNSAEKYDITSYINDREFAVSSIFVSAIRKALGTALNGKPDEEYTEWVDHPFVMELNFGPVATDLNDREIEDLFKPIGYKVTIESGVSTFREKSSAKFITITGEQTVQNALKHISTLIPVIDNYKHYFIDEREVEKLDRYGDDWLESHPAKLLILKRALRYQSLIVKSKFYHREQSTKGIVEQPKVRLNEQRYDAIVNYIKGLPNRETIVDLGAGEGKLSVQFGFIDGVKEILSIEPSSKSRVKAIKRFQEENDKERYIEPKSLAGSLYYFDERLQNKDIIVLCEVIEHIDEHRLPNIFKTIVNDYRPRILIVTTPNQEYNVVYEMDDEMRHDDHRFEWTRAEFREKCEQWTKDSSYQVSFQGIGEEIESYGQPTQMAIFRREEG